MPAKTSPNCRNCRYFGRVGRFSGDVCAAGAGVEWAFLPNWTAKVEYLYVNLGNFSCPTTSCGGTIADSVSFNENIVRAGINYKFGW